MGPKGMTMGSGAGFKMRYFIVCTVQLILIRVINYRRLRWAGHVARMEKGTSAFKLLKVNLQETYH